RVLLPSVYGTQMRLATICGSAANAPEKGVNGAAPAHGPLAHPVVSTGCALPYGIPVFFKSDRPFASLNRRKRRGRRLGGNREASQDSGEVEKHSILKM